MNTDSTNQARNNETMMRADEKFQIPLQSKKLLLEKSKGKWECGNSTKKKLS